MRVCKSKIKDINFIEHKEKRNHYVSLYKRKQNVEWLSPLTPLEELQLIDLEVFKIYIELFYFKRTFSI